MENIESKKVRKKRASVFDPCLEEVQYYLSIGVNMHAIYKIINAKSSFNSTYDGFRKWIKSKELHLQ